MNKNIFAFALCFATFTMFADDSIDTSATKTTTITIETHDGAKTITAIIVTPEQAAELLNSLTDLNAFEIIDEALFSIDGITYIIQADEESKTVNVTINVTVNVADASEAVTTINVTADDSINTDASNDSVNIENVDESASSDESVSSDDSSNSIDSIELEISSADENDSQE